MGSIDERQAIDSSIGGLVWVRRRNGSWWPGRIMAHHEVPDTCVVSPKSGTPIKLLGREDASVDWYNLEKSKRVKAFRCGEYETCIETAKATASTTGKKAVKYARREDAIVHALEIESAHLAKDRPEVPMAKDDSSIKKATTSGVERRRCRSTRSNNGNEDSTDVAKTDVAKTEEALQSSVSLRKPTNVKGSKAQPLSGKRRKTPNDSEDDGAEGTKRMRGLEDIGTNVESKRKGKAGVQLEPKQENGFESDEIINGSVSNGTVANGSSRGCFSSIKRTKPSTVNANEYSKRKNRQRPLTKVLESTAVMSVPVTCDVVNSVSESKVSAVINNNSSDSNGVSCENGAVSLDAPKNVVEVIHSKAKESDISSISVSVEDDLPNGVSDVPLTGEEKNSAGISTVASSSPRKALDSGLISNGPARTIPVTTLINGIEKSTPTWQLKGKRNSRQMSKRQEEQRNAYAQEAKNSPLPHCSVSDQNPHGHFTVGTQAEGRNSQLCDVKIEVKGNYKPRDVPLISLRSKLYGEAIVGHPITVEGIEDESFHHIVSSHIKPLGVPIIGDDAKPKKSKKRYPLSPPYKSSKSKKSPSASKKTRFLSALSGQKLMVSSKKMVMTKKAKEQIVACIPLKVVFSRINEAVKGSARQVHRALPAAGNTE